MTYLGDFKEDGDLYHKFTTRAFATGIPTQLAGVPVLSVYVDEGVAKTSAEAYFDLDVDFGGITGFNNIRIDLSGDAFFATGADYAVVITTGTVGGVSVVGETICTFSIENRFDEVTVTALAGDVITPASVIDSADFIIQALSITNALDAGSVLVDGTTTLTGNVSCGAGFDVVGALSANSLLIDTTTTLTGNVSMAGTFDVVGALTAGSVSIDAGVDVVGALSANSLLIDTTTTLTGAVSCGAAFDIVGELSANSVLVDVGTVLTGAVTTGAITAASLSITGQLDAGSILVDAGMDIVGALSMNSLLVDTTTTLTGAVVLSSTLAIAGASTLASLSVTGQFDAGNFLVDGTTAFTGAFTAPAGFTADITGSLSGAVGSVAGNVDGLVSGTVAGVTPADAAAVNAQVLDVLNVDTFAEPGQEVPTSTTTLVDKIGYIYKFLRNKVWTTATDIEVYNDAGAVVDQKSTISDDGTTFKRGEFGSGP